MKDTYVKKLLACAIAAAVLLPGTALAVRNGGGDKILLQGFHWNSMRDANGNVYDIQKNLAQTIADMGFNAIWMPPPWRDSSAWEGKDDKRGGMYISGGGEGYAWKDFDKTSNYGTDTELKNAASALDSKGIDVIYDIVANHRMNDVSANSYAKSSLSARRSGCADWQSGSTNGVDWGNRGPNGCDDGDSFLSGDIDLNTASVYGAIKGELLNLKNNGYKASGFRWDFVRGFDKGRVNAWMNDTFGSGGFCVGEFWKDPISQDQLESWSSGANCSVFDFALKKRFQTYDPVQWQNGLNGNTSQAWRERAVTFVDNHDTGSSPGRYGGQQHWALADGFWQEAAYAFILTTPGTPTVYWPDVFDRGSDKKNHILNLIKIRKEAGIKAWSAVSFSNSCTGQNGNSCLVATTTGVDRTVITVINDPNKPTPSGYTQRASGAWGKVFISNPVVQNQSWTSLNLRGTNNNWGCTAATKASGKKWTTDVTFTSSDVRFKFEANTCTGSGAWPSSYGDPGNDGTANLNCTNCDITRGADGAGTYTIEIDEDTKAYTVLKQITDGDKTIGMQRTIVLLKKTNVSKLFLRGSGQSNAPLPITHMNFKNSRPNNANATASYKIGDGFLSWVNREAGQATGAEGSPLEWTTKYSTWFDAASDKDGIGNTSYKVDGRGYWPANTWDNDYWLFDVMMDCGKAKLVTANGKSYRMFEFKYFNKTSNAYETNRDVNSLTYGAETIGVYDTASNNHFGICGKMTRVKGDENTTNEVFDIPSNAEY